MGRLGLAEDMPLLLGLIQWDKQMWRRPHAHKQTFDRRAPRCLPRTETFEGEHKLFRRTNIHKLHAHTKAHKHTKWSTVVHVHRHNRKALSDTFSHKHSIQTQTTPKPSKIDNSTGSSSSGQAYPYRLLFQLSGSHFTFSDCNPSPTALFLPTAPRRSP